MTPLRKVADGPKQSAFGQTRRQDIITRYSWLPSLTRRGCPPIKLPAVTVG